VPGPLFSFAGYVGAVSVVPPNGVPGGLIAIIAIFLPSFLLVWAALPYWAELRGSTSFSAALAGTNAAVVGILAAALYAPVWTSAVTRPVDVVVASVAFAILMTNRVPPIAIVIGCAVAGAVVG
jgi:chromate transporter